MWFLCCCQSFLAAVVWSFMLQGTPLYSGVLWIILGILLAGFLDESLVCVLIYNTYIFWWYDFSKQALMYNPTFYLSFQITDECLCQDVGYKAESNTKIIAARKRLEEGTSRLQTVSEFKKWEFPRHFVMFCYIFWSL